MPITGVAIQTMPDKTRAIYEVLEELDGVNLYGDDQKGNIIAVLETRNKKELDGLSKNIEAISGVIKVLGVYHYFEEDSPNANEMTER